MRLPKELGALNRDILAIKEKWKIALNIEAKKIAIERLITMRNRLRDPEKIQEEIERATREEMEKLQHVEDVQSPEMEHIESEIDVETTTEEKTDSNETISQRPPHLTVAWLKERMKHKK
ncbi:MAG TPA: hypothetical protein EYO61_03515 [Campylobacterales bacterium]|nr:hypothetical protein [Campylobacterales bacterium]